MKPIIFKSNSIDSIFDELFNTALFDDSQTVKTNVQENDTKYTVTVSAPSFDKSDFKINIKNNKLTITGERKEQFVDSNNDNGKFIRKEFNHSNFIKTISLPDDIVSTNIKAAYRNGILQIDIQKNTDDTLNSIEIE